MDPNVAVFYRFILASTILFGWAFIKRLPLKFSLLTHRNFIAQGFFMFCLNYLLTYWASQLAPSAILAMTFTALIYFNMFGARLFFNMPIEKKVFWGAFVSFLGMGFIAYNEVQNMDLHPASLLGFCISMLATVSASAGNLLSLQNRKDKLPITSNNAWGMLYGSGFTLLFCLLTQRPFEVQNLDSAFFYSFLYLTVFGTIVAFGAYLRLIELFGPSKAAFTSVISPVIAIGASFLFENLNPSFYLLTGVGFCLLGNTMALMKGPKLNVRKYAN